MGPQRSVGGKARLADPRLTRDHHHLTATRSRRLPPLRQALTLDLPADEAHLRHTRQAHRQSNLGERLPPDLERLDQLRDALQLAHSYRLTAKPPAPRRD